MNWIEMFFQSWQGITRTVVVGSLAYGLLVLFLRVTGKRTLAKLNAFDLVVTVALGSTLSSTLLQESVALAEGATAFLLLIVLQYAVTFLSVRSPGFAKVIRSEPKLIARSGRFCHEALKRERITEDEAMSAVRASGATSIQAVAFMILESDGTISVGLV